MSVHVMERGTERAKVTKLLWTSQKRCAVYPNPKRPTWRCKAAPVWMVQLGDGRGAAICDDHLRAMGARRPRRKPSPESAIA